MSSSFSLSKNNWLYLFFHPITLAILITAVSAWYIFPQFEGYKAELISKDQSSGLSSIVYADLNRDGNSERITASYFHHENMPGISIFSSSGKVYDQWNLKGEFFDINKVLISDYDANKSEEIYVFTRESDSIFLNAIEQFTPKGLEFKRRFIAKTQAFNDIHYDIELIDGKFFDVNNDGSKEFVFYLYAGYGLQPRNLFVFDIKNDSLIISPESGSGIKYRLQFFDMDKDGLPEATGINHAPHNFHKTVPYPDSLSWMFVYKTNGDFLFEPFSIPGQFTQIASTFIQGAKETYILSLINFRKDQASETNYKLILVNTLGEVVREKYIQNITRFDPSYDIGFIKLKEEKQPFLYSQNNTFFSVDTALNIVPRKAPNIEKWVRLRWNGFKELDIDEDGKREQLFHTNNENILVFRDGFTKAMALPVFGGEEFIPSLKLEKGKPTQLSISTKDFHLLYLYYKNPLAWLKFPLVVLAFLFSYLVFYLLVKIQKRQLEKRYNQEKQIHKYQFQGLRNQLDPHFSLNILTAIQSLFLHKDFDKAKFLLTKYGKLNRNALHNAEKIAISLEDELDFVENFLALEKFRFEDRFDYSIKVDNAIETDFVQLPRMLIHTFADNAIKHGLFPKSKGGVLKIEIKENHNHFQINIEDNGIGRAKSKKLMTSDNGKGLNIIKEIVKLYNKLQNTKIIYKTIDLFHETTSVGTRIEVLIPKK